MTLRVARNWEETDKLHRPPENRVTHLGPERDNGKGEETSKTKGWEMAHE